MQKVYKYPLDLEATESGRFRILMPQGTKWMDPAKIVCVNEQNGQPCLWALIEDETVMKPRYFRVIGTGHEFADNELYLGTAFCGEFVWHVFERVS